jgi:3-hydroxybutyryl-CoA dehydrogenase
MNLSRIKNIGVVGAGIMGHGIAQTFALGGYDVILNDISDEVLQRAIQQIRSNLDTFVEFGITTREAAREALRRIRTTKDFKKSVKEADFIVEALSEVMDLKKEFFKDLDRYCLSHAIIASNTSGLSLTAMVSEFRRKEQVVIAHWWNPPHIIPAVEIVRGEYTSDETADIVYRLLSAIGKRPVRILKETPGFLGNRLQFALYREVLACLKEGIASAEDIDATVKGSFGFRMPTIGPLETSDFGGLDTFLYITEYLFKDLDRSTEPPEILVEKVKQEKLGVKRGEGFFLYPPGKKEERIKERDRQFLQRLKCLYLKDSNKEEIRKSAGKTIDEIIVGDSVQITKTITEEIVNEFARVTGDTNPVHTDPVYAEKTMFKGRIAHGVYSLGIFSTILGNILPGYGTIYLSQEVKFLAPVRIGDTIIARVEVVELIPGKNRVKFRTTCTNQDGKLVVDGFAWGMPPKRE